MFHHSVNSGHYTAVIASPGSFPSVLYDASTQQYLIAYTTGNNAIAMQHGSTLLSWSGPIASGAITDGTDTILYPTLVGEGSDPAAVRRLVAGEACTVKTVGTGGVVSLQRPHKFSPLSKTNLHRPGFLLVDRVNPGW